MNTLFTIVAGLALVWLIAGALLRDTIEEWDRRRLVAKHVARERNQQFQVREAALHARTREAVPDDLTPEAADEFAHYLEWVRLQPVTPERSTRRAA